MYIDTFCIYTFHAPFLCLSMFPWPYWSLVTSRRHSGGLWLIFPTELDFYRVGMSCKMMLLPKCQDEYVAKLEAVPELNMFFKVWNIFWWWLQIVIFDGNGIAQNFLKGINMTVSIAWKTGYGPWELILFVWIMLVMDLWISRSAWRPKWLNQYSSNSYLGASERPFVWLDSKEVAARELASE